MKHSGPCRALPHRKPMHRQAVPSGCQSISRCPAQALQETRITLQDPESTSTKRFRDSGSWIHRKSMQYRANVSSKAANEVCHASEEEQFIYPEAVHTTTVLYQPLGIIVNTYSTDRTP